MTQKQKEMFREQELAEIGKAISEGGNGDCLHEIMHNVLKDRTLSFVTEEEVEEMIRQDLEEQRLDHGDWGTENGIY
jgi:hypothetical protein|tara:strand:+ start:1465 stop:1695 length:231 start_codon:yes stop_codon:yes gene_type:complete